MSEVIHGVATISVTPGVGIPAGQSGGYYAILAHGYTTRYLRDGRVISLNKVENWVGRPTSGSLRDAQSAAEAWQVAQSEGSA